MKRSKRIIAAFLALVTSVSAAGCSKSDERQQVYFAERVQYDIDGQTPEMTVFDLYNGELYGINLDLGIDISDTVDISIYSDNGRKKGGISVSGIDGNVTCFDILNDVIYFSTVLTTNIGSFCRLYSADINGGEAKKILEFEDVSDVKKIRASDDGKIYFLARKSNYERYSDSFYTENNELVDYHYSGEFFGSCGYNGEDYLESDIPYPVAFDERNGTVVVYAFEKETGYYFHNYSSKTDSRTNHLKKIEDMELINDNMDYAFAGGTDYMGTLAVSGMTAESGVVQLDDSAYFSMCGSICAEGDELCVNALNDPYDEYRSVFRYNTATVSTKAPPVRIISSSYFKPLFSCGSQIKSERLSSEEFALSVLSLDPDFDLMMMSTRASYADNIKEKGSFYPLNDIPGVSEYIEKCFPSVRESAVDVNGDIWMLPISLDVCTLVYNAQNCTEKGISFSTELSEFLPQIRKAADISKYFDCSGYCVIESMFNSYLSVNKSFDTQSFRSFAPMLKEINADKAFQADPSVNIELALSSKLINEKLGYSDAFTDKVYQNALFTTVLSSEDQRVLTEDNNLYAVPMPYTAGSKPCSICYFICVNPHSDRLEETLSYVERLVSYLRQKNESFVFDEKAIFGSSPLAQSLYDIYSDSAVYFDIPSEIYYNDFMKYCADEITLDEFIAEADRKLSAYLNE